jgi:hypothetical protein
MIERPLYFLLLLILFFILCILSTILRIFRLHRQAELDFQQLSLANRNALPLETTRERIAEHLTRQWRERRRSSSLSSISSAVFASIRSIGAITGDESSSDDREEKIQKAIIKMKRQEGEQKIETRHNIGRRRSSLSFNFPRSSFSETKQTDECAICLDTIHVGEIIATSSMHKCFHAFHEGCIQIWLREHDECPMCRRKWIVS